MKRRKPLLLIGGLCLIVLSLCFIIGVQLQLQGGTKNSEKVIREMNTLLPDRTPGIAGVSADYGMPVLEINGTDYAAMIEIPSAGITLPIADNWNSKNLFKSPARFSGSPYDNSLVVGGADYPRQFGFCDEIENDAIVVITDMTGAQFFYKVRCVDRANHAETKWLQDEAYDLTLFCRSTYSMEYIAVRCVLT